MANPLPVWSESLSAGFSSYPIPGFTEPVSSLSHLLAAGAFAIMSVSLLRRGWGEVLRVAALGLYAFCCVFLLSMSGVYHLLAIGSAGRAVVGRLDHAGIFTLIAGTFTPVHIILFRGAARWGPLLLVWTAAVTGITLKTIFFADFAEWLGLSLYLAFGWVGALSGIALWRRYGMGFIEPLVWGALAYTVGAALEFMRWPLLIPGVVGPHELFHVAVLAGIGCHWSFVSRISGGAPAPSERY